ncbi:hypothetical protein P8452_00285 [Trifolium repens]|nr:hypothetical protein P8452_00285 [Trifolium repens]
MGVNAVFSISFSRKNYNHLRVDQIFVVKLESVSTRGWLHFFGQCNMSDDLHEMCFFVGQEIQIQWNL